MVPKGLKGLGCSPTSAEAQSGGMGASIATPGCRRLSGLRAHSQDRQPNRCHKLRALKMPESLGGIIVQIDIAFSAQIKKNGLKKCEGMYPAILVVSRQ